MQTVGNYLFRRFVHNIVVIKETQQIQYLNVLLNIGMAKMLPTVVE